MEILASLIMESAIGAGVLLSIPSQQKRLAQVLSLILTGISIGLVYELFRTFDPTLSGFQLVERTPWLPGLGLEYHFGVDGISVAMIIVTVFTTAILVACHHKLIKENIPLYLSCFFLMQATIIGVFSALDGLLFYFFYEATLIPLFISMGVFGSKDRVKAAYKLFLYTFFGSAPFLVAIIYLGVKAESFDLTTFYTLSLSQYEQMAVFLACALAFAVKVPMWPVHTWLPDAHTEAPAGGSVMLAALMLKVGAFGFLRFNLPITHEASAYFASYMVALSLIAILFIGLVTLTQKDIKRLIAYSSIAHMGIVTMGIFLIYLFSMHSVYEAGILGLQGSVIQMVAHAFSSAGMFLAFGFIYQRIHTRDIRAFGGLAKTMPILSTLFILFCLSNLGLPGTGGFVGEIMVIMASFQASPFLAITTSITLVLSAAYTLWMVKRVFYGRITNTDLLVLKDIDWLETSVLVLLAAGVLILGLNPNPLVTFTHQSCVDIMDATINQHIRSPVL